MVYVVLRLIFFYILFLFIRSLFRSFVVGRIRKGFESMQGEFQQHGSNGQKSAHKVDDKDVIEAEYRKR